MESRAQNDRVRCAVETIHAGIRMLQRGSIAPVDIHDARHQTRELTRLQAMLDAVTIDSMRAIDESGVGASFGHLNGKVLVRHEGKLSNAEATAREQSRRMLAALPDIEAAYRDGDIGTNQVRRIARVWANKRVRSQLEASQQHFLVRARSLSYKRFHAYATDWERRADEDGWIDQTERQHANRNVSIHQDYDLSFSITGGLGSVQGAECREVFDHYVEAERLADLETAKRNRGDDTQPLEMPRTPAQRRADAFHRLCLDAVATAPGGKQARFERHVVIDDETLQRELLRRDGDPVPADDPNRGSFICQTLDGFPLNPTEVVAASADHPFRRAVIDASGVTIELGDQRFFTGFGRRAVQLERDSCYWPGCEIPVSKCQIDHLRGYARGGRSNPRNGGAACGRHNRLKEHRFHVFRDPSGEIVVFTDELDEVL